jgi:hypothetical protein
MYISSGILFHTECIFSTRVIQMDIVDVMKVFRFVLLLFGFSYLGIDKYYHLAFSVFSTMQLQFIVTLR